MICEYYTDAKEHIESLFEKHSLKKRPLFYTVLDGYEKGPIFSTYPQQNIVHMTDVNSEYTYWAVMHELGHNFHPFRETYEKEVSVYGGDWRRMPGNLVIDNECYAWEWALLNSMQPITKYVMDLMHFCLVDYISNYSDFYNRYRWTGMPTSQLYHSIQNY